MMQSTKSSKSATMLQFLLLFILPLFILIVLSGESRLGPTKALILALALPVAYELYNLSKRKKPSYMSLLAIGGILVTGIISLLGLSEDWLAVRRALPYLAGSLAIIVSIIIKHPLVDAILPFILDMETVTSAAVKRKTTPQVKQSITRASIGLSILLALLALASFITTKVIINSATNTATFNEQYAQLRLISLPVITLPLLIGVTGILFYLVSMLEKLTGLEFEKILKKK